jgi:hypothetical protein
MKITFECSESTYRWLCNIDEYVRQSPEWRHRTVTCLDDVINFVLDHGFEHFYFDNLQFQVYDARLHGAEASTDDEGNVHIFFPEEPKEE